MANEPRAESETSKLAALPVGARVGRNLAFYRQRAGLTQQQVADLARVSRATVNLIESGEGDPRVSTIELIAGALGIDPADLAAADPRR